MADSLHHFYQFFPFRAPHFSFVPQPEEHAADYVSAHRRAKIRKRRLVRISSGPSLCRKPDAISRRYQTVRKNP
jgi:hypothetical protein